MSGEEFRELARSCIVKYKEQMERRKVILKRVSFCFAAWCCLIALIELIMFSSPNWWSVPLGATLVLAAISCFVVFVNSMMDD